VADPVPVAVAVADEEEEPDGDAEPELDEAELMGPKEYTFNLLGPPQNSDELPLQVMVQPEAGAAPFSNLLSQSSCVSKRREI
jgi:hypothetical protein